MKEETKSIRWFTLEEKTPSITDMIFVKMKINDKTVVFAAYYDDLHDSFLVFNETIKHPCLATECEWMNLKDLL
jgi:hypothetical protein